MAVNTSDIDSKKAYFTNIKTLSYIYFLLRVHKLPAHLTETANCLPKYQNCDFVGKCNVPTLKLHYPAPHTVRAFALLLDREAMLVMAGLSLV